MPKQKKGPKNAFYFYMMERKQELESKGDRFPRIMNDLFASTCYPEYKNLSMEQKSKYEKLAKEAKENEKTNFENKFTTSGESYASVYRRQEAAYAEKNELKAYVKDVVRCDRPEERIYVVMKAISSCQVPVGKSKEEKEYLPLELAIAAFSIKDGSIYSYSTLVNTMSVPCGYASYSKEKSEETLLPQPGSSIFEHEAPGAKNYKVIMQNIRLFVETWCGDYPEPGYFLIFGSDSQQELACIKGCLEWLAKNSDEDRDVNDEFLRNVKYYSLPDLLIELSVLANQVNPAYQSQIVQFGLEGSALELLNSGCYDYKEEITCKYHQKDVYSQKMHLCSKNFIVRRMFLLLEELTPAFQCELKACHNISEFERSPMPPHLQDRLPNPTPPVPAPALVPESNPNPERQTRSPKSVPSSSSYVEKSHRRNESSTSSYRSADRDRNNDRSYEGSRRNYDLEQSDRDRYSYQVDKSGSDRSRDRDRDRYRGHNSNKHGAYEHDRKGHSHHSMDREHSNNDVAYDGHRDRDRDRNQNANSKPLGEAGYERRRREQNRGGERHDSNYKRVESSNKGSATYYVIQKSEF